MNGDIYVRDGSRFKKVPNMVGLYYNGITLTKEQMPDSIGIVVDQKYDHLVVCAISHSDHEMTWQNAKKWCKKQFDGKGRMPEIEELIISRKHIVDCGWLWSNTTWGSSSSRFAWFLYWYDGYVSYDYKSTSYYVRAFLDIPIKDMT